MNVRIGASRTTDLNMTTLAVDFGSVRQSATVAVLMTISTDHIVTPMIQFMMVLAVHMPATRVLTSIPNPKDLVDDMNNGQLLSITEFMGDGSPLVRHARVKKPMVGISQYPRYDTFVQCPCVYELDVWPNFGRDLVYMRNSHYTCYKEHQ